MLFQAFIFKTFIFSMVAFKLNYTLTLALFSSMQPFGGCMVHVFYYIFNFLYLNLPGGHQVVVHVF
jgi:hypothetical protein